MTVFSSRIPHANQMNSLVTNSHRYLNRRHRRATLRLERAASRLSTTGIYRCEPTAIERPNWVRTRECSLFQWMEVSSLFGNECLHSINIFQDCEYTKAKRVHGISYFRLVSCFANILQAIRDAMLRSVGFHRRGRPKAMNSVSFFVNGISQEFTQVRENQLQQIDNYCRRIGLILNLPQGFYKKRYMHSHKWKIVKFCIVLRSDA